MCANNSRCRLKSSNKYMEMADGHQTALENARVHHIKKIKIPSKKTTSSVTSILCSPFFPAFSTFFFFAGWFGMYRESVSIFVSLSMSPVCEDLNWKTAHMWSSSEVSDINANYTTQRKREKATATAVPCTNAKKTLRRSRWKDSRSLSRRPHVSSHASATSMHRARELAFQIFNAKNVLFIYWFPSGGSISVGTQCLCCHKYYLILLNECRAE